MSKLTPENRKMLEYLKNCPDWMQNLNLVIACKIFETKDDGLFEKTARLLAEYGVKPERIMPCMLDLMIIMDEAYPDVASLPEHGS